MPAFREFMQPVITEMDPEECVEDQYKVLRCLHASSLAAVTSVLCQGRVMSVCQGLVLPHP